MIRVLIVDDSAIVRDVLTKGLSASGDIEVVATAPDPYIARNKILSEKPDVVTLDIEMPRMDGLSFLKVLMTYYPLPILIVSSVSTQDKQAALEALRCGAFDVVNKPDGNLSVQGVIDEIILKIRAAYENRTHFLSRQLSAQALLAQKKLSPAAVRPVPDKPSVSLARVVTTDACIAIGASTGGTIALEYLLPSLPANLPPIVVVQHMPRSFTAQFAERLNGISKLTIKEAGDGEILQRGHVYIAPGGLHLEVTREGSSVYTRLRDGEKVQFQKPSVDVLFQSMSVTFGRNSLGVLLTGMGKDGAEGLLQMKKSGAQALIQNEESSIVWGMPRAAFEIGAYTAIADLVEIPKLIQSYSNG